MNGSGFGADVSRSAAAIVAHFAIAGGNASGPPFGAPDADRTAHSQKLAAGPSAENIRRTNTLSRGEFTAPRSMSQRSVG